MGVGGGGCHSNKDENAYQEVIMITVRWNETATFLPPGPPAFPFCPRLADEACDLFPCPCPAAGPGPMCSV